MTQRTLLLGAVAYDPEVVTLWDGLRAYFERRGLEFDFILYSNYERQVEALICCDIHIAWNSPLAWLQSQRIADQLGLRVQAVCMRDTDGGRVSAIVTREGGPVETLSDLKGRRVAVGAPDSPRATLIPLDCIAQQGLVPHRDFEVLPFDRHLGKHGDLIGGERDAARALVRGDCDAACLSDSHLLRFAEEGTLPAGTVRTLATTPPYDHRNFTVIDGRMSASVALFRQLLLDMSPAEPDARPLLDLGGHQRWLPGRTEGYHLLARAVDRLSYPDLEEFSSAVLSRCT